MERRNFAGGAASLNEAAWAGWKRPLEDPLVTSQEEQMLNSLVERVNSTQLTEKDPDAAALLQRGFGSNPDSVYILAQSVLVQNIALEQARAQLSQAQDQIAQLQQQSAQQPARATSFLGSLLGHRDPVPPPPQPQYQPVYTPQVAPQYETPYNPGPAYQGQPYGGPQAGPYYGAAPAGQPSFLRSAAQTAAGVAAGALAFEGVEALLHGGFGHPGMGMGMGGWGMPGVGYGMGPGMGMGMGYERPMEETVVNNYYDSPGQGFEHGGEHHFHESAGDGGGQVSDASWGDSGSGFDSGNDGGSGFDGGGGFDGGSGGDAGGF
jgi:hypothetical protein